MAANKQSLSRYTSGKRGKGALEEERGRARGLDLTLDEINRSPLGYSGWDSKGETEYMMEEADEDVTRVT